jgi:hypothetical protein
MNVPAIARYEHQLADDPVRGRLVLFGGGTDALREWDGSQWLDPQKSGPGGVRSHAMSFAPNQRVLLFEAGAPPASTTSWTYDRLGFTPLSVNHPGRAPGARMVHDAARDCAVLFGGKTTSRPADGLAIHRRPWRYLEWDGTEWIERQPLTAPASAPITPWSTIRCASVVLFGGDLSSASILPMSTTI